MLSYIQTSPILILKRLYYKLKDFLLSHSLPSEHLKPMRTKMERIEFFLAEIERVEFFLAEIEKNEFFSAENEIEIEVISPKNV